MKLTIHKADVIGLTADLIRLRDITPSLFDKIGLQQNEIELVLALRRKTALEALASRGLIVTGYEDES